MRGYEVSSFQFLLLTGLSLSLPPILLPREMSSEEHSLSFFLNSFSSGEINLFLSHNCVKDELRKPFFTFVIAPKKRDRTFNCLYLSFDTQCRSTFLFCGLATIQPQLYSTRSVVAHMTTSWRGQQICLKHKPFSWNNNCAERDVVD